MTLFTFRFKGICDAAFVASLRDKLDLSGYGPANFVASCNVDGDDSEPTHFGSDWQCTPEEWGELQVILGNHGVKYALENQIDKTIRESNIASVDAKRGQVNTFAATLTAEGLKRLVVAMGKDKQADAISAAAELLGG